MKRQHGKQSHTVSYVLGASSPTDVPTVTLEEPDHTERLIFKPTITLAIPDVSYLTVPQRYTPKDINLDSIPFVEDDFSDKSANKSPMTATSNVPTTPNVAPSSQRIQLIPKYHYFYSDIYSRLISGSSILLIVGSLSYTVLLITFLFGMNQPLSLAGMTWTSAHFMLRFVSSVLAFFTGCTGIASSLSRYSRNTQMWICRIFMIELVSLTMLVLCLNVLDVPLGLTTPNTSLSETDRAIITLGTVVAVLITFGSCMICTWRRLRHMNSAYDQMPQVQNV
jgi:hypothetical protein